MAISSEKERQKGQDSVLETSLSREAPDSIVLLEELRIREAELALRNEELRLSRQALEESRDRYLDLYEFAPVAYLTLTHDGMVSEINLAATGLLLGKERKPLLHRMFSRFIATLDKDRYSQMFATVKEFGGRQACALTLRRGDDSIFHAQLDCVRVFSDVSSPMIRVVITDLTERKLAEEMIESLAFYDPLTKLPNRRLLLDRLQHAILNCKRSARYAAILFVDLDDFKTLNDTQGHDAGDLLLKGVAGRLTACIRANDTVARLGGDEFVVMLEELSPDVGGAAAQARAVGEKVLASLKKPYPPESLDYRGSGSVGITLFSDGQETVDDLLKRADMALYRAKAAGGGVLRFFEHEMQVATTVRAAMEADIRRGLRKNQFVLWYQAQVNDEGMLTGAEVLVRWNHPLQGLLLPGQFVPLAEEKGLIIPLGRWVLEAACRQLVVWNTERNKAHLTLAVNVSAREFAEDDFVDRTLAIVTRVGANPKRLVLELTESLMLGDGQDTVNKMNALRNSGLSLSLDDFGTGYSSLAYLKRLPLNQLKIDRSFVRDMLRSPTDAAIADTVIALGNNLGLAVIAEGVESSEQQTFLASHGCKAYQGYFYGKPGSVDDLPFDSVSHGVRK